MRTTPATILAFFLCLLDGRADAAPPLDYATFVERVARQHPEASIDQGRLSESEEARNRSGLLPDPQLTAGRSDPNFEWEASLSQSFPWPGTLAAEERIADAQSAMSQSKSRRASMERRFAATELFLHKVRTFNLIEVQRANLAVVDSIKDFAHAKFRQGLGSHMEFLQSHSEGGILRANLAALETDLRNLKRHAVLLLNDPAINEPDDLVITLEWPALSTTQSDGQDFVREGLVREQDVETARNDAAYRRSLPSFTATATVMKEEMGEPMYGAMAGVSIPLFSSTERRSLSRASAVRESRTKDELSWHDRRRELARAQTVDRITQLESHAKVLRDEIVPPVKEHIEAATAQFGQGKAAISAVIEGRRTLLNLQVTEIITLENLALAKLGLEKIQSGYVEADLDMHVPQLASPSASSMNMDMGASGGSGMDGMTPKSRKTMPMKSKRPTPQAPMDETRPASPSSGMGM